MNIPEEFGNYLLLKKLREDALGETFRAGRVGREGIEQVVLLRVFNGQGMDGEKLWQRISGRAAVQQALRSPNIGSGVDLGKVRSFPYAAYDYISGKNLATLFAEAARQRQPIPIDHALLITERLALALAAAYETRAQDERLLHGFVVPHLVMISNEGETRMLGFEVAPGLRDLWAGGWRSDDLRGYLAPEAAAAAAVAKTNDVYSLGAILFELLASERLPLSLNSRGGPADGATYGPLAALIDGLVLPNEGTPLPAAVAALLKKSLAPPEQRIPDAVTWHKTTSKLMIAGHFSSTTFTLASFLHNLFRDEIDRELQEREAEKKLELPQRLLAGAAGATAGAAGAGSAALAASAASGPATTHAGAAAAADARERTAVRDAAWAASASHPGAVQPLAAARRRGRSGQGEGQDAGRAAGGRLRIGERGAGRRGRPPDPERAGREGRPGRAAVIGIGIRPDGRLTHGGVIAGPTVGPRIVARIGGRLGGPPGTGGGRHPASPSLACRGHRRRTAAAGPGRRPGPSGARRGHAQDHLPAGDALSPPRPAHEPVPRAHREGAGRRAGEGREARPG